ncbi:MAG: MopE-related protein [Myxococcota bacterium]|nr:MopE-related protein [Myxococcota bacterium]
MRWLQWMLCLGLFSLAGCNCGGAGVDTLPFACTDDTGCEQPDWLCRRGACVRADAGCAAALEICDDGLENDCDGLVDCADDECSARGCGNGGRTCVGAVCSCPPGGGDGGVPETNCQDGQDDDCDGQSDCDDPDCAGSVCDPGGLICVGASCQCPPAGQDGGLVAETACNDGVDNDCDGQVDCQDASCEAQACSASGTCTGGACLCTGGGNPETPEATCNDGADNDCDGLVDCADLSDCSGRTCGVNGLICGVGGACVCSGNGSTAEPGGETRCNDGSDNDCDGLSDCADPDCSGTPEPGGEVTCDDGRDNDCDGQIDCQELACDGQTCGAQGQRCGTGGCACTGNGGAPEADGEHTCNDGADNDCDGLVDCADPDCLRHLCGTSSVCCSISAGGCRNLGTNEFHCGGCGTTCDTSGVDEVCQPFPTSGEDSGRCTCNVAGDCRLGQTCNGGTCRCATEANCQPGQVCESGTCLYPPHAP